MGQYWKDVSGQGYGDDFARGFSYDKAVVRLAYNRSARGRFKARLKAEGLKPNFCYQVKLEGKPWGFWVYASDDVANEALGRAGHFWRAQPEPREVSLEEFEADKDKQGYVFIGSVLLDFLVTDEHGKANVAVDSYSSLKMVWKPDQRTHQPGDGPIRDYRLNGQTTEIYGENLAGGGAGSLELPVGPYNVQVSLTEESFGDPEGAWARIMVAEDVSFEIEKGWSYRSYRQERRADSRRP